jgi:AAHS family 4-hydroxybenzoate transporter-like MFS transporter
MLGESQSSGASALAGMTGRQTAVIGLCALLAMIDGLDTQTIGLVAPAIASAWHVAPAGFGPVFGSSLFSGMIGAFLLGQAADRFGRKAILTLALLLFAVSSLATPLTQTLRALLAVRLVTGFGLGGAIPIIIAITSEAAPRALRLNIVSLMYCGFPLGSMGGSLAAARMIPSLGWASVFYLGGAIPLVLLVLVAALIPASRHASHPLAGAGARGPRPTVGALFADGRAPGTLLLWAALFLSLLLTVFLVNWLPLVTHEAGLGMAIAVLGVGALNFGGIIGTFLIGWACKRLRSVLPIALSYGLGALAVCAIGLTANSTTLLLGTAFIAGLLTVGSQMCTIALSASFYESELRATGVGWAFGVGRIGAVVGPVLGGILIGYGISVPILFLTAGTVSLGAALAVRAAGHSANRNFPGRLFPARAPQ